MKVLVRSILAILAILAISIFDTSMSLAGNGKGPGNGTGPICTIVPGSEFTYEGPVVKMAPGEGLVLSTTNGAVTIYGVGPYWYWKKNDMARPVVSDDIIKVDGYVMDLNGVKRNIASSITTEDGTIQLRDADGKPLWSGKNGSGNGGKGEKGNGKHGK